VISILISQEKQGGFNFSLVGILNSYLAHSKHCGISLAEMYVGSLTKARGALSEGSACSLLCEYRNFHTDSNHC
jgi:hypothetical protein